MTNEASKTKAKFGALEEKIFHGAGIDIGCGGDPIYEGVRPFDVEHGDANKITSYVAEQFDYVFSSHCLEHMLNPYEAIQEWWKLVKENGYMYIAVPDEDLYEQGIFPSRWNQDHKWTFTMFKQKSWCEFSVNIVDLIKILPSARLVKLELQDDDYNYDISNIDQTYIGNNMHAMAQIVFALQKQNQPGKFSLAGHFMVKRYDMRRFVYKIKTSFMSCWKFWLTLKRKLRLWSQSLKP
jgi:SAM-dependent methyltransferase